jgi:hypothetical protein
MASMNERFPAVSDADLRMAAIEQVIANALADGWSVSRGSMPELYTVGPAPHPHRTAWTISSTRYDLGYYEVRLTGDLQELVFVHSNDIHNFLTPTFVEEVTLIQLDGFTPPTLATLLRHLMETRRPNLVHPT